MTVVSLKSLPDKEGRKGRHIDFVCIDCLNVWWRMVRSNLFSQNCPKCKSKRFICIEGEIKVIQFSPACKNDNPEQR